MKKFLPILLFAVLGTAGSAHSQILEKTKVSVQVGYDFRDYSFDVKPKAPNCTLEAVGFVRAGFALDVPMGKENNWLFETGLYYARQGMNYATSRKQGSIYTNKTRVSTYEEARGHMLELPIMFGYQHNVWKLDLNLMVGGYVNYAVGGSCDQSFNSSSNSIEWGQRQQKGASSADYDDAMENFDAGIQAEFGVRWKRLYLGFAYQHGFCDLIQENDGIEALHSNNFTLKAGFTF